MDFKNIVSLYFNAITERNLELLKKIIKRDGNILLILPNGELIEGDKKIIDFHNKWFSDDEWSLHYEITEISEFSNIGRASAKITYSDLSSDGTPYKIYYLLYIIFYFENGKWFLFHDQNTLLKKEN